jgi:hypothetical protein
MKDETASYTAPLFLKIEKYMVKMVIVLAINQIVKLWNKYCPQTATTDKTQ